MLAAGVIKAVDVLKARLVDVLARNPSVLPDPFSLQVFEEGLDGGIVVAVTCTPASVVSVPVNLAESRSPAASTIAAAELPSPLGDRLP